MSTLKQTFTLTFLFGVVFGAIVGILTTYNVMVESNYLKVYHTTSGDFIIRGDKIYDLQELKVSANGKP